MKTLTHIWPAHMDKLSRDDLVAHLTELIDREDRIGTVRTLEQLAVQRGKVEGYRYLLSLIQSVQVGG